MSASPLNIGALKAGDEMPAFTTPELTRTHFVRYAGASGDFNPLHVDEEYAKTTPFGARVAHGPLTLALCAGPLGTELPGLGTVAVSNRIEYLGPLVSVDGRLQATIPRLPSGVAVTRF